MRSVPALLAAAVVLLPVAARPQVAPPRPGIQLPQAYYDRIAEDKGAFQFQKAWIEKTRRAKRARETYFASRPHMQAASMTSLPDEIRRSISVAGTVRVPVILIKYSNTGADPFPAIQVQNQIFDGPTTSDGTLTDLYDEMSYGVLHLTGDVWGWVTAAETDTYYEGGIMCHGLCSTAKTGQLILEALQGVDAAVDFSQYDNDGPDGSPNSGDDDGYVDFIAIVHPEIGGECGNTNMWSHRWIVGGWPEFSGPWTTNDDAAGGGKILVWDYTIQPVRGSVNGCGSGINEIGVFAHEFGHAFGLPDFYDTNGGGEGIGGHGLMGTGNWRTPPNPVHMSPYCKAELGWIIPQVVGPELRRYEVGAVEVNKDVYRLNIHEERFKRSSDFPIEGTASLSCGLTASEAAMRNWPGSGYGNNWRERIDRTFTYNGSNPVTLQYDASYHTEAAYDFARVIIQIGGSETVLRTYDDLGTDLGRSIELTPYLNGSGASEYKIILEFESDARYSDEDGLYASSDAGPFKVDNISVTGGGESYFSDFEQYEDGWRQAEPSEYFLVENRQRNAGVFDRDLNADGLLIWHVDRSAGDNTGGTGGTPPLRPARLAVEQADGFKHLELGANRGDAGDSFPGNSGNTNFDNNANPNSMSNGGNPTTSVVSNINPSAATMTADMKAGRPPPSLASVTPNLGYNDEVVAITALLGAHLVDGGTFCLRDGVDEYEASGVEWIGQAKVTGELDLNGLAVGTYDVVWRGPDGQEATLAVGFTVDTHATGITEGPVTANKLDQNHPNPFNPATTISYTIKERGRVTLRVYNLAGQIVRTLVDEVQTPRATEFTVVWNGRNDAGRVVASGVYLYKLTASPEFASVKKLVLLR